MSEFHLISQFIDSISRSYSHTRKTSFDDRLLAHYIFPSLALKHKFILRTLELSISIDYYMSRARWSFFLESLFSIEHFDCIFQNLFHSIDLSEIFLISISLASSCYPQVTMKVFLFSFVILCFSLLWPAKCYWVFESHQIKCSFGTHTRSIFLLFDYFRPLSAEFSAHIP